MNYKHETTMKALIEIFTNMYELKQIIDKLTKGIDEIV